MTKPISIIRAPRSDNPYFMMARSTAQDENLSYEALGMLTYLLSKPDNWQVRVTDLEQRKTGRERVRRIMKELQTFHYVIRRIRRNEKGQAQGWDWEVHETPAAETESLENRKTAEPSDGKPVPLDIKENTQNTESNRDSADGENTPPPVLPENPPEPPKPIQENDLAEAPKKQTLFDWCALEIHGLIHVNGQVKMVGQTRKWLLEDTQTPPDKEDILLRDLIEMRKWWSQTKFTNDGNPVSQPRKREPVRNALIEYRASTRYKDLRATEALLNGR